MAVVLSQYKNKPSFLSHCWSNSTGRGDDRDCSEGTDTDQTSLSANIISQIDMRCEMMSSAKSSDVSPQRS